MRAIRTCSARPMTITGDEQLFRELVEWSELQWQCLARVPGRRLRKQRQISSQAAVDWTRLCPNVVRLSLTAQVDISFPSYRHRGGAVVGQWAFLTRCRATRVLGVNPCRWARSTGLSAMVMWNPSRGWRLDLALASRYQGDVYQLMLWVARRNFPPCQLADRGVASRCRHSADGGPGQMRIHRCGDEACSKGLARSSWV